MVKKQNEKNEKQNALCMCWFRPNDRNEIQQHYSSTEYLMVGVVTIFSFLINTYIITQTCKPLEIMR